jgi:glycosyltransferase involved in cell wall biosynthesis
VKRKEVVLVYRKQYPYTFSIEFIFDNLMAALGRSVKIKKYILPRFSNSFFNRMVNMVSMLLLWGKIVHVTGDVHYAILGAWFNHRILTIHDLSFMHRKKGAKRSILKWMYIILPVRFAHLVTVISEATKRDLLTYVKVDPQKLRVIPDFISDRYQPVFNRKFNFYQPKILQIGTAFNKNIDRLAEAISDVSCTLTIIGELNDQQKKVLKKFEIQYINKVNLSEKELDQEYAEADILAFVSTIEGFGMPILEAQAYGLPVITSNCSSMPEVAGDAAVYADPKDIASIRNGIFTLINDEALRLNLIEKGFINLKRFSKEKVVKQYQLLYEEAELKKFS